MNAYAVWVTAENLGMNLRVTWAMSPGWSRTFKGKRIQHLAINTNWTGFASCASTQDSMAAISCHSSVLRGIQGLTASAHLRYMRWMVWAGAPGWETRAVLHSNPAPLYVPCSRATMLTGCYFHPAPQCVHAIMQSTYLSSSSASKPIRLLSPSQQQLFFSSISCC